MPNKRVAVIGAGPSGMVAVRRFAEDSENFTPVGFEINREVGGLWNYSDNTDIDDYGQPCFSSIYKTLKINFPKEMMGYQDFDFPTDLPECFVKHNHVKTYLDDYAVKHDLNKYIRFQTRVTNVKPTSKSRDTKWEVTSHDLKNDVTKTEEYDAVLVCIGSDSNPYIPDIPGQSTFKGRLLHSKSYRDPTHYQGATVVVVGGSFSALDLMLDLAPVTKQMYVAHRNPAPFKFTLPDKVEQTATVEEILPNGVRLVGGRVIDCDVVILATGYYYDYPFLAPECNVDTNGGSCVRPLYRHLVHVQYPTLCFIDLITRVLKMKLSDIQAQYLRKVFRGDIKLPSEEEMRRAEAADYQKKVVDAGQPPKMYHDMIFDQWDYTGGLADEVGCPKVSEVDRKLFARLLTLYELEFPTVKKRTYKLIGDTDFEETL